ncbi:MAG: alpha-ketoglutarate-dependent taurine dioxygenase [Arenicella sp.]|jgi:alpha-ketoglutarate-dependent taurine dioxygenase
MSSNADLIISTGFQENGLPVLIAPPKGRETTDKVNGKLWPTYSDLIQEAAAKHLPVSGGILFRGFAGEQTQEKFCNEFAKLFADSLLSYEFGSTPRTDLGDGVYTATEYPSHQVIPLHNEQSYTLNWPLNIWFHCVLAPKDGGETPIADSRRIYNKMPIDIRQRFESKKLTYVRNYGNGLDLGWEQVFNTDSKVEVESYCRKHQINFKWKDGGELRTWQKCQATAQHHTSKEWVWFNQAHLFHVSNIDPATREILLDVVEVQDLPRNVYYGDGSEIEESILAEIRGVLDEETVYFPWHQGDFLMLDNMLSAHGRSTFSGDRKIVVAMANAYSLSL